MSSYFDRICSQEILLASWKKIKSNNVSPGIDRVSCQDFEQNLEDNLDSIRTDLISGSYSPLPVITFKRKRKKKGMRLIGIPAVRDRVVQQAILMVLTPRFERLFFPCCYAYRPGKSALHAVRQANKLIRKGNLWVLQMDIKDFFECLDHSLLLNFLDRVLKDQNTTRLISRMLKAKIFYQMGIFDHLTGTHQGSGISPLLSNIYLHPLDHIFWKLYKDKYLRYSDDITIFSSDEESLKKAAGIAEECLTQLKLELHPGKTSITHVSDGIVYLGYHLDCKGMGPSQKSIEALENRLMAFNTINRNDNISDKIKEAKSIIRGWLTYYSNYNFSNPPNIISLLSLFELFQECGKTRHAKQLLKLIDKTESQRHHELFIRAGDAYAAFGMKAQAIRQYAKSMELEPRSDTAKKRLKRMNQTDANVYQKISHIQLALQSSPGWREGYEELRDCYLELGLYGFAEKAHNKALEIDDDIEHLPEEKHNLPYSQEVFYSRFLNYKNVDMDYFLALFCGDHQHHGKQWVDEKGKWGFIRVDRPIKREIFIST